MENLEHFLKIHLRTLTGCPQVVGQHDYDVCWRAAVENVLGNIVDELNKKQGNKEG